MISTTTFTSGKVLNKILDDSIPKLTCLIATPVILYLIYLFLLIWEGIHLMVAQLPFAFAVLFMTGLLFADWFILERVQEEVDFIRRRHFSWV